MHGRAGRKCRVEGIPDTLPATMSTQKTIGLIIAALVAVAIVFGIVLLFGTKGGPRDMQPDVSHAPSSN